jgi:UPF0755 protein
MKKLLFLVLFMAIVAIGSHFGVKAYMSQNLNTQDSVIIEVQRGASLSLVASLLAKQKLIRYPRLFVKIAQFQRKSQNIKFGEYQLKPDDTYQSLLDKMVSGETYRYKLTFVEGEHMYHYAWQLEEAGLVKKEDFLRAVKDTKLILKLIGENLDSLEGYLFPETYSFSKTDSVENIVGAMVQNFKDATKDLQASTVGLSRHQWVTLASIIEKETGAPFERPLISSVFHNRLKKKMRLQTDPTIIYGILHETGEEIRNIRRKDIRRPTAYNTYVIPGLPPGPIGNPGAEALKAALQPAASSYLYFVSQNDGTHVFTKTYKDHLKAVKKFQLNPKMRQGKSWRNLKKTSVQ